jgi:Skp family chaperone for outer membrane proteins
MKKIILLSLIIIFSLTSLTFAQTITPTTSTSTSTTTKPLKQHKSKAKEVVGAYEKCLNLEMKNLTKEMQERKKNALAEYKNTLKNATSTEARKEARKGYTSALKDIQKWFNQATKEAKEKCRSTATTQLQLQHLSNINSIILFLLNLPIIARLPFCSQVFYFSYFSEKYDIIYSKGR